MGDDSGNLYITGYTNVSGLDCNAFISKYYRSDNQIWINFWDNSRDDKGYGIALDNLGNINIIGFTNSIRVVGWDYYIVKNPYAQTTIYDTESYYRISGYNIIILIGFFGLISIILSVKLSKK